MKYLLTSESEKFYNSLKEKSFVLGNLHPGSSPKTKKREKRDKEENVMKGKLTSIILAVAVAFTFSFADVQEVSAASKPAKVKSIYVSSLSQSSISVSWTKVKGAKGYQLFRNGKAIRTGKSTSFTDTGLSAGTAYTYKVRAFKYGKKKKMWYNKSTGKWQKKKPKKKWRGKSKKIATYKYGAFSRSATAATRPASYSSTPASGGNGSSGGGSSGGTTPASNTVTDYLGVTRTIKNVESYGGKDYYEVVDSSGLSGVYDNLARIDRTAAGEFTISGRVVMVQTGGEDSATFYKKSLQGEYITQEPVYYADLEDATSWITWDDDKAYQIVMFGGDPAKLTYELDHEINTVNTYRQSGRMQYNPYTRNYIDANSGDTHLQEVLLVGVGKLKYPEKTAQYGFGMHLKKPDRSSGCGFESENITITIKYDGKKIGGWTWNPNENATGGMTANRAVAWQIAQDAIAANGGKKDYYTDMRWIQQYFHDTYTYGQEIPGATFTAGCEGGAFVLETYSVKEYGEEGFWGYGSQDPEESSHTSFNMNSDPSTYFETQGHR